MDDHTEARSFSPDSDQEIVEGVLRGIWQWDGTNILELDSFTAVVRLAFDARDWDTVLRLSYELLYLDIPKFHRARPNAYLAFVPSEDSEARIDIAQLCIQEAADSEDVSGEHVSDLVRLWKKQIQDLRAELVPMDGTFAVSSRRLDVTDSAGGMGVDDVGTTIAVKEVWMVEATDRMGELVLSGSTALGLGKMKALGTTFPLPAKAEYTESAMDLDSVE
ncbi:hypothetical protein LTR08_001476 [Meristemomyces frigidus]|nr:hypothetical protein LTR08_001476 [Meristemomyces frigidus]